jgi:general secretion pathway protein D
VNQNGDVSLNYVDADVKEVARLILGDILKVNYTIDAGFQGMVTIQTARPLARDELLPTLSSLLEQAGGSLTYRNGAFRISTVGDEAVIPPVVDIANPGAGTQVVPLHFASAKQLAAVLEPYVGDAAKILPDTGRNVLIVTGSASARQGAIDLIEIFDVDYLAGQSYALFPAKTGDPNKLAADLEAALQLRDDGPIAGALKIVPIVAANAVMAIAQQQSYLDRVSRLVAQLDRVKESAGRTIHVYYL